MLRTKAARGHGRLHGAVSRFLAIALACLLSAGGAAAQTQTRSETKSETKSELKSESGSNHLRGGWYPWDPCQYSDYKRGVPVLTDFDVEIERALARIMAVEIDLPEIAWKDHLAALIAGTAIRVFLTPLSHRDRCPDPAARLERPLASSMPTIASTISLPIRQTATGSFPSPAMPRICAIFLPA